MWANKHFLKLNDSKTKFLAITTKLKQFHLPSRLTEQFCFESTVRNLGFIIDNKLSFNAQINRVCQVSYFLLKNLRKISSKLTDINLKILLVKSCILSHIDYCNSLYIFLPDNKIKKLQRVMNAAIRFIYNLKLSDDYSITFYMKQCHFLPVKARVEYKIAVLVYKCLNNLAPEYLANLVEIKDSLDSLRISSDRLLLKTPRLNSINYKNRSFTNSAPRVWNKLPLILRQSGSLAIFQSRLKTHLFELYFS